jgi:hypothetical protein
MKTCVARLVALIILVELVACSAPARYPVATRTTPPSIPAYPSMVGETTHMEKGVEGFDVRVTRFQTSDTPTMVTKFYMDRLTQQGWTVESEGNRDFLIMRNARACPLYALYVISTPISSASTNVELRLEEGPCSAR